MNFPTRCLSVFSLALSGALWAQTPEPAETVATPVTETAPAVQAAPVEEVIRKAIPVDEPTVTGTSAEIENLPRTLPEGYKMVYTRCEVPGKVVALTFDDGPHPEFTPRLLNTLRARNIKATFYMVGRNVQAYPHIVRRMAEEGHEVANHSWSHPLLTKLKDESLDSQIKKTHDAIIAACGKVPLSYRPPYGEVRLSQRKMIRDTFGYPAILWDVDPLDWQSPKSTKKVHDRILNSARSGSIILCHDIHETTVNAMPALLDEMTARGFQFATVTQLLQLEAQNPPPVAVAPADGTEAAKDAAAPGETTAPSSPLPTIPVTPFVDVPAPELEAAPQAKP